MDGPQDLGGRMGFGPVAPEADEPIFHAEWEKRALGVTLCCGALGYWNLDSSRHARESLPPSLYLNSSYYRIWTEALERLLLQSGELSPDELGQGRALKPGIRADRKLEAADVRAAMRRGGPVERHAERAPRFQVGAKVRTRKMHPKGHTRLPAYARDKCGIVSTMHGAHVFPDVHAHGGGESPEWLYTVEFDAQTLWGADADPNSVVSIDAWEPYLEAAE